MECEKLGVPRSLWPICRITFKNESREKLDMHIPTLHQQIKSSCDNFKEFVAGALSDSTKSGHIKAMLSTSKKTPAKLKWYEQLEYSIFETNDIEIPLGDSIVVLHVNDDREYKNFIDNKKNLLAVILPISTKRVICGTKNKNYIPDFPKLKQAIISTSRDFFLFSRYDEHLDSLKEHISTNSHILSEDEIKKIIIG